MKRILSLFAALLLLLSGCSLGGEASVLLPEEVTQVQGERYDCAHSQCALYTGEALSALRAWANSLSLTSCPSFPQGEGPDDVEGGVSYTFTLTGGVLPSFRYRNNGPEDCYVQAEEVWYRVTGTAPSDPPGDWSAGGSAQGEAADMPALVRVGGILYSFTGRTANDLLRCGVMDGEITSMVYGNKIPTEEGQSNFAAGLGYQLGPEGELHVKDGENWLVFLPEDRPEDLPGTEESDPLYFAPEG